MTASCASKGPALSLREASMASLPLPTVAGLREVEGLTYLETTRPEYAFDLYLPEKKTAPRPLVLLIHGGAPAVSGLRQAPLMRSWARQIATHDGAAVAVIGWDGNKRLVEQIDAAYSALRGRAAEFGIDAARPCIVTFSAGVAAVIPHALRSDLLRPRCIVGLYGDWQPATQALGAADVRGLPILVVRTGADEIVPDTSAPAFVATATRAGARVQVLRHPRGVHVFEVRNPDAHSGRILHGVFEFLDEHLRRGGNGP